MSASMALLADEPASVASPAAPLSLRRNVSWTFAGNLLMAVCNFVILQLLVKLGSPELVGQFVLGASIATPLLLFTDLSLRSVQATDSRRETAFGHYLGMRACSTSLAMLAIAGVLLIGGYAWGVSLVLLAIGGSKALESISDIVHGLMQQGERLDWVARSLILRGVLSVAVVGFVFVATESLWWTALALIGVRLAVLWVYDLPSAARCLAAQSADGRRPWSALRPRFEGRVMRRLLWLSWPLGLTVTLGSLHTYVPRYFVERFHGEAALGIYGAFAYIVTAGQMVIAALGAAASPRLARYYAEGDLRRFFELVGRMAMLCGATGLAMVGLSLVAGRPLLEWLFAPEYAAHLETFTWLMAAGGLNYVGAFLGYATTATRRFHSLAIPYSASALLMVLLSALLVPAYGIRGAAWVAMGFSLSNLSIALALLRQAARKRSEELEVGRGPTLSGCETADEVS